MNVQQITLIFLTILTTSCAKDQFEVEKDPFAGQAAPEFVDKKDLTAYAAKNHGVVNIHRHGPGFDVLLTLNAGDSDMIFSMNLPEGGQTFAPELQGAKMAKVEAVHEEGRISDKPINPEEENEFFNEKSLSLFSEATKHMLNAQALFYRKSYWKALEETNKAVSLVPKSAQAYALKGSIYFKMGRKNEAKSAWQQALALDPSLTDVKQSLQRIQ